MDSEKWCSVAKKLLTVIAVLIALLMFVYAVLQAVEIGSSSSGYAVLVFFIVFIGGCVGSLMLWFVTRWCILVLEELVAARKDRRKLQKTLLESFYKQDKDTPVDGYFRFSGKQALKTNELLETIAAYLAASSPAEESDERKENG